MKCNVCGGLLAEGDVTCDPCEQGCHRIGCSKEVLIPRSEADEYGNFGVVVKTFCNWCAGDIGL